MGENVTISKRIIEEISRLPAGEPFTALIFRQLGRTTNIRKVLSRLVKSGELIRLTHGVYCKPKYIEPIGLTLPSLREIAFIITQATGESLLVQGAEAARQLGLSTQVPMHLVFYTNGNSRKLTINGRTVTLKHANPSQLICANNITGTVISALKYLGQDTVNLKTIKKISLILSAEDFTEVLTHVKYMPAWMADIFYLWRSQLKD